MALKNNILTELMQSKSSDLSGQQLAEKFGVSRNAIWKAINSLKRDGYEIASSTNRGYRLVSENDILSADLIKSFLDDTAMPVYIFDTIDSTIDEAKRILAKNPHQNNFLVVADAQTNGRGRRGRSFCSPKGAGLYMSLVTAPRADISSAVGITSYASVCVAKAIEELAGKSPKIKWVNDIFVDGKKVCGILTEAITCFEEGIVSSIIIGIGVNLHSTELPEELRDIVGFLDYDGELKNRLAADIVNRLIRFDAYDKSYIEDCRRYSMVLSKEIAYYKGDSVFYGKAVDIDENGGLVVKCQNGTTETLNSGEITIRVQQ